MSVDTSRTTALAALVTDRQRCCSAQCVASIAFQMARNAETQRQHYSFKPDHPIQYPQSQDPLNSFRHPPHRHQIAIACGAIFLASTPRGFLPWALSDDGPSACRTVATSRRPKPFTTAEILQFLGSVSFTPAS